MNTSIKEVTLSKTTKHVHLSRGGAPTVVTPYVLIGLREAFLLGATDAEACSFTGISDRTLYRYQANNPEFCQQKEQWKAVPTLKARRTIVDNLSNPRIAMWFLERMRSEEFNLKMIHKKSPMRDDTGYFDRFKKALGLDEDEFGDDANN